MRRTVQWENLCAREKKLPRMSWTYPTASEICVDRQCVTCTKQVASACCRVPLENYHTTNEDILPWCGGSCHQQLFLCARGSTPCTYSGESQYRKSMHGASADLCDAETYCNHGLNGSVPHVLRCTTDCQLGKSVSKIAGRHDMFKKKSNELRLFNSSSIFNITRDKIEFRLFNSSSIFNNTSRRVTLFTEAKPNHTLSWFHVASFLSQVPWREVEVTISLNLYLQRAYR